MTIGSLYTHSYPPTAHRAWTTNVTAMLSYACGHCGRLVFFENTVCLHCSTPLGFVPDELDLVALEDEHAERLYRCANTKLAACFAELLDAWLPLTYALNAVNRSMGRDDLYPFTLAPSVIAKLEFVHERVQSADQRTQA